MTRRFQKQRELLVSKYRKVLETFVEGCFTAEKEQGRLGRFKRLKSKKRKEGK